MLLDLIPVVLCKARKVVDHISLCCHLNVFEENNECEIEKKKIIAMYSTFAATKKKWF